MAKALLLSQLLAVVSLTAAKVPIIGWSTSEHAFTNVDALRAGSFVPVKDVVTNNFDTLCRESSVVVFEQDMLHLEDITKYSKESSMNFMKASVGAANSTVMIPSVKETKAVAQSIVSSLAERLEEGNTLYVVKTLDDLSKAVEAIKAGSNSMFLVHVILTNVVDSEDKSAVFAANDKFMELAISQLIAVEPSLAVLYTGNTDSKKKTIRSRRANGYNRFLRNNATSAEANITTGCRQWPANSAFPEGRGGSKTCRPTKAAVIARSPYSGATTRQDYVLIEEPTLYFSVPILMGITVAAIIIPCLIGGTFGLMVMQTNSRYPNMDDVPLIISTANE